MSSATLAAADAAHLASLEGMLRHADRILFTSSVYPYPTLPNDTSLTDATGARFTRADGVFCLVSHSHHFANHLLAQNIRVPSVVLEYPRWDDFTAEVARGYPVIGISALPVHLDSVLRMCTWIREHSPQTTVLLGCYAGMALQATLSQAEWKRYVDFICHGEGVQFMRHLLGEDTDRPIRQTLMPKGGGAPPFITKFPKGAIGFLVSGLGCPGRCPFCSSTALYDHQRLEMLSPEDLVEHMYLYHRRFPHVTNIFVIEEDHFRWPDYLAAIREPWQRHPDMAEALDWFAFGSLDFIGKFVERHGWDAIPEAGIGVMFVGVESKFTEKLGLEKRKNADPRVIFRELHRRGIRTVGSWICGWDFHTHANILEDLNYFVGLYPTYQQLTRLSPFPGTRLWDQMREEGRLRDVPWGDMHFWSGSEKHLGLEEHETLNLVEQGYELLYRTWGPSMLRRLDVELNGYAYCRESGNRVVREHRSQFFRKQCGMAWTLLPAMERLAPNGIVRRRARQIDRKYRATIGEPTAVMQLVAAIVLRLAQHDHARLLYNPSHYRPKEEPFKRYVYEKRAPEGADVPYRTEWPGRRPFRVWRAMAGESVRYFVLDQAMRLRRATSGARRDPVIDDYLLGMVSDRAFGFGL
jgi:hypothetical protein